MTPPRGMSLRPLMARTGVRLALVNAAVVLAAFILAGCMALLSIQHLSRENIRDHVYGEVVSLDDEFVQKGAVHLRHTIAKRERLWRGFDYRLTDPQGVYRGGRLPSGVGPGWTDLRVGSRTFLVFSRRLPDGGLLTVGQDLTAASGQMASTARSLLVFGGLGVGFCLLTSYLFNRQAWRRIGAIADAARQVADGRLDVRAPVRRGRRRDDLDELGQMFNGMLERIEVLLDQLRQVSVDIAHDMRTPLTRVHQKLERVRAGAARDPALLAEIRGVEDDIAEVLRTFDALLQLSEIGGQSGGPSDPRIDLGEVAERVAEAFRPDIEDSGRRLEVDCASAHLHGDGQLLAQVVSNLLENSLRHTPVGARVRVEVRHQRGHVALCVSDDGPGVALADREAVLKPFVRLEPSRHTPGSGLGLSIVSAIAARHGASLSLNDARPGLGVELAFQVPDLEACR